MELINQIDIPYYQLPGRLIAQEREREYKLVISFGATFGIIRQFEQSLDKVSKWKLC